MTEDGDYAYEMEAELLYYDSFRLCHSCIYFDGESNCEKYPNMKVLFFGRKYKCKYYIQITHEHIIEVSL